MRLYSTYGLRGDGAKQELLTNHLKVKIVHTGHENLLNEKKICVGAAWETSYWLMK